jgi:hypothetical protein
MKKTIVLVGAAILAGASFAQVANPSVTQANIKQTICVAGWTATVRPPVAYTSRVKRKQLDVAIATGTYPKTSKMQDFELDHILPLSSGGAPKDTHNLTLQLWSDATKKDVVEKLVQRRICSGRITLAQGQQVFIAPNAWRSYK